MRKALAFVRDPQVLVTLVATVDAADQALFGASFKAMETSFGFTPGKLGVLQMWQTLSFSLSLPVWGVFLPVLGARYLLCLACAMWAGTTLLTPHMPVFEMQCLLRFVNGAALSGVMPITQAILADSVESAKRGAAFGWLQALHTLAKVFVSYAVLSLGDQWAQCYYCIFFLTLIMIAFLRIYLPADFAKSSEQLAAQEMEICSRDLADAIRAENFALANALKVKRDHASATLNAKEAAKSKDGSKPPKFNLSFWSNAARVVNKIVRIPTFLILVLQGVAGGTPWNAMGFLNVYYAALGFDTEQVARISALTSAGGIFGTLFGGYVGDIAARKSRFHGRILTAQSSVLLGIPAWYFLLSAYAPSAADASVVGSFSSAYAYAIAAGFSFFFVASWTPSGANRPICADLLQEPGERAQIVAIWVMIEGVVGAMLGAPLVGFISEFNGYDIKAAKQSQNAAILASALFRLGLVCWTICFLAWCGMHLTLPLDLRGSKSDLEDGKEMPETILI